MPVRAILSDLDDTLFDHHRATRSALSHLIQSEPCLRSCALDDLAAHHHELLERFHLEVLAGRLTVDAARMQRFQRLLEVFGSDDAATRAAPVARTYRSAYESSWHAVAGARELVAAIKAAGLSLIIVTNNIVLEQEQKLRRLGIAESVDHLVASEEAGCSKPDPQIFVEALRRAGAAPAEAVMLGDAWATDIEGARAAGVRPVWLNRFGAISRDRAIEEIASLEPAAEVLKALTRRVDAGRGFSPAHRWA
jgi:putative hydrolase of the HAD superfamily